MVLDVTTEDDVLVLTLSRADALNAFTVELHDALASGLREARADRIKAVVLTGAGRAFCAGQDLEETQTQDTTPGERLQRHWNPAIQAVHALEKPVVAAVNGVAAGAGIGMAMACDLRVASERASFVPAFAALGLVPDSGVTWFAARTLGYARAFDWLTSNRRLGAVEALEWGVVQEVVAADEVRPRAIERAAALAAAPGLSVPLTKRALQRAATAALADQLAVERQLQQAASEHPAYAAEVAAFLGRRPS
jgi:2-(1,2-epoxy-1,2-dihydrophenyl)acetyl-CoA isomerase